MTARARSLRVALLLSVPLCLGAPVPLFSQVGHDPARSPFRDIITRQNITFLGGRFAGNRTEPGVGARPGAFLGVRLETRVSGALDLGLTVGRVGSSRFVVNPLRPPEERWSGPQEMTLVAADAGLQLNLTGTKTWHRLAPFVGIGIGIVAPTRTVTDTGGYNAGSNFTLVPALGTRLYLTRHMVLRVEARDYYFRYEWPLAYFSPVDADGNAVPSPVLPAGAKDTRWTHNYNLAVGLAYAFTF